MRISEAPLSTEHFRAKPALKPIAKEAKPDKKEAVSDLVTQSLKKLAKTNSAKVVKVPSMFLIYKIGPGFRTVKVSYEFSTEDNFVKAIV